LLKYAKIIIFTLFIVTTIFVHRNFAMVRKDYGSYEFVFEEDDSLLVRRLFEKVQLPLQNIERFFGGTLGSRTTILITKSRREYEKYTRRAVPEWSQAVAFTGQGLIVLRLATAEDIKSSPQVLLHELTHIFIAARYPEQRIPRWLNEGLAQYLSGQRLSVQQKVFLANAVSAKKIIALSAIDSVLGYSAPRAHLAYAQSLAAVDFIVRAYGRAKLRLLLDNMARYHSVNDAFKQTVGFDFIDFELAWYEDLYARYRWLVILNIDNFLWIFMGVLALLAIWVIRRRNRKKISSWEEYDTEEDSFTNLNEEE